MFLSVKVLLNKILDGHLRQYLVYVSHTVSPTDGVLFVSSVFDKSLDVTKAFTIA